MTPPVLQAHVPVWLVGGWVSVALFFFSIFFFSFSGYPLLGLTGPVQKQIDLAHAELVT